MGQLSAFIGGGGWRCVDGGVGSMSEFCEMVCRVPENFPGGGVRVRGNFVCGGGGENYFR